MVRFKKVVAAVFMAAAIVITGCGKNTPPVTPPETSLDEQYTTTQETTAAAEETTAETEEEEEEMAVNEVRTAEELAGKKVIALTFDDGPNTGVTNEILDILEEYGIKASFYVIGQNITPESAKAMKRAHAMGCEINSHSYTHSYMNEMTAEEIKDEMDKTAELIYENVGEYPKFFRPPYIAVSSTMYETIDLPFIAGLGCNDWDDKVSVEKRVRFLTEKCPEGCIILLHDQATNEKTVEAVRQAVPMMLEQGFEFVTTAELFVAKGIVPATQQRTVGHERGERSLALERSLRLRFFSPARRAGHTVPMRIRRPEP